MNKKVTKNTIGVIGAGHIGQALILKLLEKGYPKENIRLSYNGSIFTFSDIYDNELVDNIRDNSQLVKESSIIILSVPPQNFKQIGKFGLDKDTLVISFMAGISVDSIKKQTGSENVVRVIPTGPDTIKNSEAIAGVYPSNNIANEIFDLLDFDYYLFDNEEKINYMVVAGCLPAVFCRVDPRSKENVEDIKRFAGDWSEFIEISRKMEKLVPKEDKEKFISNTATPGGVTASIINGLNRGDTLYNSLVDGLKRNKELSQL